MNSPDVEQQKKRNRRVLLTIALVFILPLTLAKLVLALGWYEPGVSQKGNLVEPELQIHTDDNAMLPATWRIAYRMPETCDSACENALYVSGQLFHALGRQQSRVTPVAIRGGEAADTLPSLPEDNTVQLLTVEGAYQQLGAIPEHSLMIIDPVGTVILWYPGSADRREAILHGRDLLSDLQKLLKLSRVG
ncbi:hypothetical protein [Aliidiomarina sanyensis]|uniref:Cytochrome oxidase assembly protein n=1 Tax=Aliidiomarina sanyensis TaxID=1249555 RepID=A0A432WPF5_9GAMM|nr:hypothetical protein [Aliidiomarina sanyensis]RUO35655.1 hypothetical protein CWE11_02530 [Aliidiomarina sanyensis]